MWNRTYHFLSRELLAGEWGLESSVSSRGYFGKQEYNQEGCLGEILGSLEATVSGHLFSLCPACLLTVRRQWVPERLIPCFHSLKLPIMSPKLPRLHHACSSTH